MQICRVSKKKGIVSCILFVVMWGQLGWDLALDRIYEINFLKTKNMLKNSQKN
jgi:hypothetical protein